jgi:AraC family transcriptional regulator
LKPPSFCKGGLTAWQFASAKELISEHLNGDVCLAFIAQECGMSPSHFARAFRQSAGIAPHQWLLLRRVDAAKRFLRQRAMGTAEIALAAGFSDQSHFTRVFSRIVGTTPLAWRALHSG